MPSAKTSRQIVARRQEWIDRVNKLAADVESWADHHQWSVNRQSKTVHEERLGDYEVPFLRVRHPQGEFHLDPIGLNIIGGNGRVDLQGWPTLNRVKLIGRDKGGWAIVTDSNVSLKQPWNEETFVELVKELTS